VDDLGRAAAKLAVQSYKRQPAADAVRRGDRIERYVEWDEIQSSDYTSVANLATT